MTWSVLNFDSGVRVLPIQGAREGSGEKGGKIS